MLKMIKQKTPKEYDSQDVRWQDDDGELKGYGYIGKESKIIHVLRCPQCLKENYLAQSICVWCGFAPIGFDEKLS